MTAVIEEAIENRKDRGGILSIEDEGATAEEIRARLTAAWPDTPVTTEMDPQEAIRRVTGQTYEWVLLDLGLTECSEGLRVFEQLVKDGRNKRVIIYTNNATYYYSYRDLQSEDDTLLRDFYVRAVVRKLTDGFDKAIEEIRTVERNEPRVVDVAGRPAELAQTLLGEVRHVEGQEAIVAFTDGRQVFERVMDPRWLKARDALWEGAQFDFVVYSSPEGVVARHFNRPVRDRS